MFGHLPENHMCKVCETKGHKGFECAQDCWCGAGNHRVEDHDKESCKYCVTLEFVMRYMDWVALGPCNHREATKDAHEAEMRRIDLMSAESSDEEDENTFSRNN